MWSTRVHVLRLKPHRASDLLCACVQLTMTVDTSNGTALRLRSFAHPYVYARLYYGFGVLQLALLYTPAVAAGGGAPKQCGGMGAGSSGWWGSVNTVGEAYVRETAARGYHLLHAPGADNTQPPLNYVRNHYNTGKTLGYALHLTA